METIVLLRESQMCLLAFIPLAKLGLSEEPIFRDEVRCCDLKPNLSSYSRIRRGF